MTDLSKIPLKRPKVSVSLSLDKENVDFLKKDIEEYGGGITLSGVFNFLLKDFIEIRKKSIEENKKEQEGSKNKEAEKDE